MAVDLTKPCPVHTCDPSAYDQYYCAACAWVEQKWQQDMWRHALSEGRKKQAADTLYRALDAEALGPLGRTRRPELRRVYRLLVDFLEAYHG